MAMVRYEIPATSFAGVATGLSVGEFISEFVARVTGQTGWAKFGIKAGLKGLLGLLAYMGSGRVAGNWGLFLEVASYGSFGSIVPDLIFQLVPGGIIGVAETAAVSMRARGVKTAAERMEEFEKEREVEVGGITVK